MAGLMGRPRRDEAAEQRDRLERALETQRVAAIASEERLAREIERLSGLCAALEERLHEATRRSDEQSGQTRRAEDSAAALASRLERVERDYEGVLPTITRALVRRLELEQQAGGADSLATTVLRLDRELKAQAAEMDKVAHALLARIDLLRPRDAG